MEFDSASLDWREPFGGRLYQNCLPGVRAIFENLKNPVRGRPAIQDSRLSLPRK